MKKSERISMLESRLAAFQVQADRRTNVQRQELNAALKALQDGDKYATLCVHGRFIPVLVSDVAVTVGPTGLRDVVITAYPQLPQIVTEGR